MKLDLTLDKVVKDIEAGILEPWRVIEYCYGRIKQLNESLKAFITVYPKEKVTITGVKPLLDMPISLKDLFYTRSMPTTAGSRILSNFTPSYDAAAVVMLREAGGLVVGKTNLHEFAFGVTNKNPHYGVCRNPWNREYISGGSSGGSAVSVATGMCLASLGTDTAGSVRIPASLCGVVGYKPTYGVVSTKGVVPLSWTLDHVGFLTKCVKDAALLMKLTTSNEQLRESLSLNLKPAELKGLKIGIPSNYFLDHMQKDVERTFYDVVDVLQREGADVRNIVVDSVEQLVRVRYVIVHAEAAAYHKRFIRERFNEYGEDLKRRLAEGVVIPASMYINAQRLRKKLVREFRRVFKEVDFLLTPTTPITAPRVDEDNIAVGDVVMDVRPALLRLTEPFNVAGVPALSIPVGFSRDRLPIGLQIVADVMDDAKLLALGLAIESVVKPIGSP